MEIISEKLALHDELLDRIIARYPNSALWTEAARRLGEMPEPKERVLRAREGCSYPRCRKVATEIYAREKVFRGKKVTVHYVRCRQHPLIIQPEALNDPEDAWALGYAAGAKSLTPVEGEPVAWEWRCKNGHKGLTYDWNDRAGPLACEPCYLDGEQVENVTYHQLSYTGAQEARSGRRESSDE